MTQMLRYYSLTADHITLGSTLWCEKASLAAKSLDAGACDVLLLLPIFIYTSSHNLDRTSLSYKVWQQATKGIRPQAEYIDLHASQFIQ